MKRLALFAVLLACLLPAVASAQVIEPLAAEAHPPLGSVKIAIGVEKITDGDTVVCMIYLPWGIQIDGTIRAVGYDCWESRKGRPGTEVTDEEVKKGKAAARALQELFDLGEVYAEPEGRGKRDVYGRLLARLWVKTEKGESIDVAAWMRKNGHCRPDKVKAKADGAGGGVLHSPGFADLGTPRPDPVPEAKPIPFDAATRRADADRAAEAFGKKLAAAEKAKTAKDTRDRSGLHGGPFGGQPVQGKGRR